ncbi:MAG: hypothetical protein EA350_00315 [Gemmatimonadales bacterium]|nr:MAG: hypothetical protein EA350_00315 [Gemmatimonadales bacterium]
MHSLTETRIETLERVAAEAARWLASPAAQGTVPDRRERVAGFFHGLLEDSDPESVTGGVRIRVDPLEAPPVDDGSPMATFLTLTGTDSEIGVLVLYGVHTALLVAEAGVPGCRRARLDPATGDFIVTHAAYRMPESGPVQFLGGRTLGSALYRVLLAGGGVVGPGMDPDARTLDHRPTRDRAAALLLEAAGGEWISPSAFGSTRILGELAAHRVGPSAPPGGRLPPLAEPLFGSRGLFRP